MGCLVTCGTFSDGTFREWDVSRAGPFVCAPIYVMGSRSERQKYSLSTMAGMYCIYYMSDMNFKYLEFKGTVARDFLVMVFFFMDLLYMGPRF
jgi:hypothetical protein